MIRDLSALGLSALGLSAAGILACLAGCAPATTPATSGPAAQAPLHDHPSAGPHQGQLIELGEEEYHAELVHDDAAKTVTIYLLDNKARDPVAIADAEIMLNLVAAGQPLQASLAAQPQEVDATGQASRFSTSDEKVLTALDSPQTTGRFQVTIGGKSYTGEVKHAAHGEH